MTCSIHPSCLLGQPWHVIILSTITTRNISNQYGMIPVSGRLPPSQRFSQLNQLTSPLTYLVQPLGSVFNIRISSSQLIPTPPGLSSISPGFSLPSCPTDPSYKARITSSALLPTVNPAYDAAVAAMRRCRCHYTVMSIVSEWVSKSAYIWCT